MRTEFLIEKVYRPYIRQRLCLMAYGFAKQNTKAFKDLVAWGWIRIAELPEDWSDEAYLHAAFSEMYRYYEENLRREGYRPRRPGDDKAVRRVRKYFKKLKKSGGESGSSEYLHSRGGIR